MTPVPTGKFIGPPRVWNKLGDIPGLMMSRTFGDEIGHACGIICTPGNPALISEVKIFPVDSKCQFYVIGSDGLWEMLPETIIGQVCLQYLSERNADAAAKELCRRAQAAWQKNMIGYVDDITAVVIYLSEKFLS